MAEERPLTKNIKPGGRSTGLRGYEKSGGYEALRPWLSDSARQDQSA